MKRSGIEDGGRSSGRRKRRGRKRQSQSAATQSSTRIVEDPDITAESHETDEPISEEAVSQAAPDAQEPIESLVDPSHGEQHKPDEPPAEATAGEQVALLNAELQDRDVLITALTEQLEEAANRLDRFHRQGADRAPIGSGNGNSSSALDGQSGLNEQLGRLSDVVTEWQVEEHFDAISRRLDEIQESIARAPQGGRRDAYDSAAFDLSQSGAPSSTMDGGSSVWEDMKAEVIRRNEDTEGNAETDELVTEEVADSVVGHDAEFNAPDELLTEFPAPIDLEDANEVQLREAVEERDEFISRLIRKLRSTSQGRYEPIDWEQVTSAPEDLRERLEELESRLQELLRLEECELSLERARLARDRAELEQLRHAAGRNGRAERDEPHESAESERERRWLRVFGFGKKAEG